MTLRPRAVRTDRQKGSLRAGWPCCAWVSGRCRGRQHRSVALAGTRHTEGTAVHKADCWPGYSDAGHGVLCVFGKGASGRVCCALTELSGRVCCALEEFFCRACCVPEEFPGAVCVTGARNISHRFICVPERIP